MEIDQENIPERLRRFTDPSLDRETKLIAARGMIPIPPEDIAIVLYLLTGDPDPEVASESANSIFNLPEDAINRALSDNSCLPGFLDYVARNTENDMFLQNILINNNTDDSTIIYLAKTVHNQTLLETISDNHIRILRSYEIIESLSENPALTRSTLDKVISFISLYIKNSSDLPEHLRQLISKQRNEVEEESLDYETLNTESFFDSIEIPDDMVSEDEDLPLEVTEVTEDLSSNYQSVLTLIKQMSLAERLKLCIIGNFEARRVLIKDPNKIVALASLKNPRITEIEVSMASQSTSVCEDVLREISKNRDWTRHYDIKYSLVFNPKSPPDVSLSFIKYLKEKDLKILSRSKNVPGVIITTARRMILQKQDSSKKLL